MFVCVTKSKMSLIIHEIFKERTQSNSVVKNNQEKELMACPRCGRMIARESSVCPHCDFDICRYMNEELDGNGHIIA